MQPNQERSSEICVTEAKVKPAFKKMPRTSFLICFISRRSILRQSIFRHILRHKVTAISSFFPNSRNFVIRGGKFIAQYFGATVQQSGDSGDLEIPRHRIHLDKHIYTQQEFTFMEGKIRRKGSQSSSTKVIIQWFDGPRAKQLWQETVRCNRPLMNPHLLQIMGISPKSDQESPLYIVFDGDCRSDTRLLLASLIYKEDQEITTLRGTQVVHAITSALEYLSRNFPGRDIKPEHLNVFSDAQGKTVLSFTPDITALEGGGIGRRETSRGNVSRYVDPNFGLCNSLIRKIFDDANHMVNDWPWGRLDSTGTYHRQFFTWEALGAYNLTLLESASTYGDLLTAKAHFANGSEQPVRWPYKTWRENNTCPSNSWEEITFRPDAFKNNITFCIDLTHGSALDPWPENASKIRSLTVEHFPALINIPYVRDKIHSRLIKTVQRVIRDCMDRVDSVTRAIRVVADLIDSLVVESDSLVVRFWVSRQIRR
ncbi:hypothetical protein DFJ43DRAFT_1068161 [Lentinula guzmanii]|uniref:Uncharacterized protein n=1 Tax=Lentinula guzmanii TaxID=2804957 RepID=A0AA38MUU2_9AGAR|nr:hypothetical protein DFJ43DRAFT_1068161 [Lentinula guzmanii]